MPLFILTAFIYYFILEKKNKQKIDEAKISIWYSEQEKSELDELSSIISNAQEKINLVNEKADSEGVSRNKDGSISLRSNLGKELMKVIDENNYLIYENQDRYLELNELPLNRWKQFLIIYVRKNTFLYTLIGYLTALPIMTFIFLQSLSSVAFKKVLFFPSSMFNKGSQNFPEGKAMWIVLAVTIITFIASMIIANKTFNKQIKRPQ